MIDVIVLFGIILGIILIKYSSKKQNKLLRNIGIIMILICLVYALPDILSGMVDGFIDGWREASY